MKQIYIIKQDELNGYDNITQIGDIGNYYGSLSVKEEDGKFYWSIENYDGHDWSEITKKLYNALIEFNGG